MIEFNEKSLEESSDNENSNSYSKKDNMGCKLCLDPIFFEPDKFITADFQIEVRNLCPGSRIALIVEIRRYLDGGYYKTLATIHDIFDVPHCNHNHKNCNCKTVIRVFRDIILDLHPTEGKHDDPCQNLNVADLNVVVVKSNYISRNDSSCHFYD